MPQFLEWITSNFFIVIIIVGALISVFGKKNAKPNGGGEPFGGRGASPQRQGNPARRVQPAEGERQSPFNGAPTSSRQSNENRRSDSQRSGMNTERTNLDEASRQMNAEIEKRLREQRSMQRGERSVANATRQIERAVSGSRKDSSKPKNSTSSDTALSVQTASASSLMSNPTADELRKGVLWAEVLGSPRARKPYSSGRR
ncbi:hypothetical protein [Saccharibacillus sacchari]|uniref:Uncharacterized protein n=1 Tax=Saccharibacillus sacchari TaxID=456493 RepID=A0ACC6PB87_9BACL